MIAIIFQETCHYSRLLI